MGGQAEKQPAAVKTAVVDGHQIGQARAGSQFTTRENNTTSSFFHNSDMKNLWLLLVNRIAQVRSVNRLKPQLRSGRFSGFWKAEPIDATVYSGNLETLMIVCGSSDS